jgi:hypothetical protein
MNWAWATSLDQLWRSPTFPMWLTLAAAGFFGIIVLITLLRAEKSVANGALTVITLLAVGIAVAATIRGFGPGGGRSGEIRSMQPTTAALPALSCLDDMAGETVLTACEKAVFGSPEAVAAALSYAASQISRVTASGDAAANKTMTPEALLARRAVERDRYGLMAYALAVRDHCTPTACAAFRSLADSSQIVANMNDRVYEGLVARYAPAWNAPPPTAALAALPPTMPTGRPTNADFPSASSTPPVSIMTPEPGTTASAPRSPGASQAAAPARASSTPGPAGSAPALSSPALAAAKKQAAPKNPRAAAPVQLSPAPGAPAPAASTAAPAASND